MKLRFRAIVCSSRSRSEHGVEEYPLDLLASLFWRKMYPRRRAAFVEEQIGLNPQAIRKAAEVPLPSTN